MRVNRAGSARAHLIPTHVRQRPVARQRVDSPGIDPNPRLAGVLRSIRRAPATPGRFRETACPREPFAQRSQTWSSSSARIICPKWPTPGRISSELASECLQRHELALIQLDCAKGVLDGTQVAGAVIEDGNHNKPLGRRQLLFEARVLRARVAHRAREALEDRLDLVVIRPAVQHLGVQIRAGVVRRSRRRNPRPVRSADRRPAASSPGPYRPARGGRPDRRATTASVSSMGSTK